MLSEDLQEVRDVACFTITDMATWFEVDRSSMRKWMVENVKPHPVRAEYIKKKLRILEKYLKKRGRKLPIPAYINQFSRKAYILGILHELETVSKAGTPKRRL